uniref:rhodanese-like domain-containing protein n=1 Tax=Methylotuvimicrobium sp. KM2 TaxID=3133976 RepID=UPI0040489316
MNKVEKYKINMPVQQISPTDLNVKLQSDTPPFLLDVREPYEFAYARIAGSVLIPLHQIPERLDELDAEQEIVVICHHGIRSQQAASFLERHSFRKLLNLRGGIDAWSCECDASVPRY